MEFVYVVKRHELYERRFPHGLELLPEEGIRALHERIARHGFFVERRHAEQDATMKQLIPYCVVVRRGEVFLMRRLASGGESRLHGKRSVGVGGHVNPVDGPAGGDVLAAALRREVEEELCIGGPWDVRLVGVLNDDSTDVGAVHFGLVGVVTTDADVTVRETEVLTGAFTAPDHLRALLAGERATFETWSALVLDRLDDLLA